MNYQSLAEQNLIFSTVTGSIAYGTNIVTSDCDIRGIFIGNPINILTPFYSVEQVEYSETDTVFYELRKFIKLVTEQNPNILELLWVDERHIINDTPWYWEFLRSKRNVLLSSKARHTFAGYGHAQLKRLETSMKTIGHTNKTNQQRIELCNTFGYDTKYAMHLIRLFRMGIEILQDGIVQVNRPDASFLLDIRNGKYTFLEIKEMAEELENEIQTMKTDLPHSIDIEYVSELMIMLYKEFWITKNLL